MLGVLLGLSSDLMTEIRESGRISEIKRYAKEALTADLVLVCAGLVALGLQESLPDAVHGDAWRVPLNSLWVFLSAYALLCYWRLSTIVLGMLSDFRHNPRG